MVGRMMFGGASGAMATALLLLMMQALIKSDRDPFQQVFTGNIVDFVPVEEEIDVPEQKRLPERPPEVDQPPPELPRQTFHATGKGPGIEIGPVEDHSLTNPEGTGPYVDGDYLPIFKVEPRYPHRAISRGIEGHVLLEFTVTRTGSVRNPVVVESSPPGIFDRAAKEAALKFKYKPRVLHGAPIAVSGVVNRIVFSLQDS